MNDWKDQLAARWAEIIRQDRRKHSKEDTRQAKPDPSKQIIEVNLGIDLGTTYTKTCYRVIGPEIIGIFPFRRAVPESESTLLPSSIWMDSSHVLYCPFDARPADVVKIDYFKMHLAGMPIGSPFQNLPRGENPFYGVITAYYLFRVLCEVKDTIRDVEPFINGNIHWSARMGVPVGYLESPAKNKFEEALHVAASLFKEGLAFKTILFQEMDSQYSRCLSEPREKTIDYSTTSELEAEIMGIIEDRSTKDGIYALFDIGGGTIDGAVFSIKREMGENRANFLTALVAPLGFEATADEILTQISREPVVEMLAKGSDSVQVNTDTLIRKLRSHVSSVIVLAKKKDEQKWIDFMEELPVYICGGGRFSKWHCKVIQQTYGANQHGNVGIPRYSCKDLSAPSLKTVKYNGASDPGRYLVAYGLGIPKGTYAEPIGFPKNNPEIEYRRYDSEALLDDRLYDLYGETL